MLGGAGIDQVDAVGAEQDHLVDAREVADLLRAVVAAGQFAQQFDVVFLAGMAEGTFPDWRATGTKEQAEEVRNAFVAVTRSKRLLYLSYPATRVMPWGGTRRQVRSRFLANVS